MFDKSNYKTICVYIYHINHCNDIKDKSHCLYRFSFTAYMIRQVKALTQASAKNINHQPTAWV